MLLDSIRDLLLNLLFILVPILLVQLFSDKKERSFYTTNLAIFLGSSAAIILCISFPMYEKSGFIYDMRIIPLLLGCFYGSRKTRIALLLLTIGYRLFFGGPGLEIAIIYCIAFGIITELSASKFLSFSVRKKAFLTSLITVLTTLFVLFSSMLMGNGQVILELWLLYVFIQTIGVALCTYLVETIRNSSILRRKLIRYEKLEIVSHLAASISHEVRNPMTSIRGFLQLMQEDGLSKEQRNMYLKIAIEELDRAGAIISDYLIFARPFPNKIEPFAAEKVAEKLAEVLTPFAMMNNVRISFDYTPCKIEGDQGLFQQALMNIMKNAVEAMPSGGVLSIEIMKKDESVFIKIIDTGIGMTKEQISRLGEPYFTTKEGGKGTGLGMMVTFRIVESMKGTIHVDSEPQMGTAFILRFPLVKELAEN